MPERAIDKLAELYDPRLDSALRRWEQLQPLMAEELTLPQSWREVRTYLDPRAWNAGYLGVRGEIEISSLLRADLKDQVPQALLRDLYRPLHPDLQVRREPTSCEVDPGGRAAMAEARAARTRDPVPIVDSGETVVLEAQLRRRRFLQEPWQPHLEDSQPRRKEQPQDE